MIINGPTKTQKAGIFLFKYTAMPLMKLISTLFNIGFQTQIITDEHEMIRRVTNAQGEALLETLQQLREAMTRHDQNQPQA